MQVSGDKITIQSNAALQLSKDLEELEKRYRKEKRSLKKQRKKSAKKSASKSKRKHKEVTKPRVQIPTR